MQPDTMPNLRPSVPLAQCHTFALPQMCPISGNPQPGSVLEAHYRPIAAFLEVEALAHYIASFVGGRDGVRDMEQTIQAIAAHCAERVGVRVVVIARLVIATPSGMQRLRLVANSGVR